jgi:Ca2+-binding EF-hand superfamily protein
VLFDKSGDGFISKLELKTGIESTGLKISDDSIDEIIEMIDFDTSKSIKYDEFIAATIDIGKFLSHDRI